MTTDTKTYEFERSFPSSPDQLWHLLTDAKMREAWGAPGPDMVLTVTKEDLCVGGLEHHRCGSAEAPEFEVATRWYRLDGPSDAVFTETIEAEGATVATSLVTYRVNPRDSGSDLSVSVTVSSFCGAEALDDFHGGWTAGLDNLKALVENQAVA